MSENATFVVVMNDNSSSVFGPGIPTRPNVSAVRPPVTQVARDAVDVAALRGGDKAAIRREIEKMFDAIRPQGLAAELAADGSVRLSSMNAVFALAVLDAKLGGGVLPRLRGHTSPADFRSTAALAALLQRMLLAVKAA